MKSAVTESNFKGMSDDQFTREFGKPSIRIGSITLIIGFVLAFVPAFTLWLVYGVVPTPAEIAIIFTLVVSSGFAWMVVEPISYYGVLGAAGSYMAFLSGNISNMRLPCAMVAQEVTGVKPGTKEGELMATIGHCGLDRHQPDLRHPRRDRRDPAARRAARVGQGRVQIRARLDLRDHVHQLHGLKRPDLAPSASSPRCSS